MDNRLHGLSADFPRHGVVVRAHGGRLGLSLRKLGYGTQLSPVAPARPQATRNSIEYRRGDLTEWYVNGPLGLEQGFTLARDRASRAQAAHARPRALGDAARFARAGRQGRSTSSLAVGRRRFATAAWPPGTPTGERYPRGSRSAAACSCA